MTVTAMTDTRALVIGSITEHLATRPRSLQKRIGPSQLGTPCLHCLAARLAEWATVDGTQGWLAAVGTAVHAMLAELFAAHPDRFLVETEVTPGTVAGTEIRGSCDLYVKETGTVVDHKVVGADTLRAAKVKPSDTYQRQVQLYGLGLDNAGWPVSRVAINYLPRQAVSLSAGVWWETDFDPQTARDTLTRADHLATDLHRLEAISVPARDAYITGLPRALHCFDCARFPDAPHQLSRAQQFAG